MPDTAAAINEQTSQIVKALDRLVDALLVTNGELEEIRKLLAESYDRKVKGTGAPGSVGAPAP
jgi:hypothetical protein